MSEKILFEDWIYDLCAEMRKYGIRFKDLANELGCSQQWVSSIVNGKVKEPKNTQLKFTTALKCLINKKINSSD